MADLTARHINAPSFASDWLLGALAPHGIITNIERKVQLGVYFDLLERLVWRQLMVGQSAAADCAMTDEIAARWRELADRYHADLRFVECVCSDEAVHRSRLEGRKRGIPGWHEVGWDHVERIRRESVPAAEQVSIVHRGGPRPPTVRPDRSCGSPRMAGGVHRHPVPGLEEQ